MIGLVVAAHGHLAPELIAATEQILGRQKAIAQCSVDPGASAETLKSKLQEAINRVDEGDGVLVLADLLGGSPCTQSLSLCQKENLEVVTGVNLPMLVNAYSLRNEGLKVLELAQKLVEHGQKTIMHASAMMRSHKPRD